VGAEHHQVFPSGAVVLLAAGTHLKEFSNEPALQFLFQVDNRGCNPGLVGQGDLNAVLGGHRQDGVGLLKRASHRFLHVHVGTGFGCGRHHFQPVFDPARPDRNQIRFLFAQHLAPVGVRAQGARALNGSKPPGRVFVGHRHDSDVGYFLKSQIKPVPVVAPTGASDHGSPISFSRASPGALHVS
jgi:hypothetical protein